MQRNWLIYWRRSCDESTHSVAAGQIRERDRSNVTRSPAGDPDAVDNPREAWIVVEDAHEAIIDKSLFELVQTKLHDRRRDQSGQSFRSHIRRTEDAYTELGLVYCAHCGCKMHGNRLIGKGHRYPKYSCSTYVRSGKDNPHGCGCHGVHQDQLVDGAGPEAPRVRPVERQLGPASEGAAKAD
jgi:Recombinase zinc beta ribbon domain/Recombinase